MIETCQKYGHDHPKLWTWALSYLTHQEASGEVSARLAEVLRYIDEHNLLSPLMVIDILAQNPTIYLHVIQEFISRRVQLQQNQIHDDEQLTAEFTTRTTRMREQLSELTDGAVEFKEDRCGVCREPLELPSVHFLWYLSGRMLLCVLGG
jgi:vacuolar protein sorting-associated protein 11